MRRARKALAWTGIGLIGLSWLLVMIVLLPGQTNFEPPWIRNLPLTASESFYSNSHSSADMQFRIAVRRPSIPMEEVRAKLQEVLPANEGWIRENDSWTRKEGETTVNIYAIAFSDPVEITTMAMRPPDWRDRVKIWLVRMFGRP